MIQSISNINFKGFYSKKNERYTDSQNRCIDNIKKELGDIIKTKDFEVQAGKGDTVELYHIEGLREGIGVEDSYYKYSSKIGTFDENHPFKIEYLKKYERGERARVLTLAIPVTLLLCGVIGLMARGCTNAVKKSLNPKPLTEKIIPVVKDTLNNVKDTTKLFIK